MFVGMRERIRVFFFVKRRKEQDVERVFNDCAVMAICEGFGNVTRRRDLNDQNSIGVEGCTHQRYHSLVFHRSQTKPLVL